MRRKNNDPLIHQPRGLGGKFTQTQVGTGEIPQARIDEIGVETDRERKTRKRLEAENLRLQRQKHEGIAAYGKEELEAA